MSIGALRLAGYKKALESHRIPVEESRIRHMDPEVDTYSIKSGYKLTRELLDDGVDCTAIFALSDSMAIGAVRALIDAGKKVPEDISVAVLMERRWLLIIIRPLPRSASLRKSWQKRRSSFFLTVSRKRPKYSS